MPELDEGQMVSYACKVVWELGHEAGYIEECVYSVT